MNTMPTGEIEWLPVTKPNIRRAMIIKEPREQLDMRSVEVIHVPYQIILFVVLDGEKVYGWSEVNGDLEICKRDVVQDITAMNRNKAYIHHGVRIIFKKMELIYNHNSLP